MKDSLWITCITPEWFSSSPQREQNSQQALLSLLYSHLVIVYDLHLSSEMMTFNDTINQCF
jgi:hypothetical protein